MIVVWHMLSQEIHAIQSDSVKMCANKQQLNSNFYANEKPRKKKYGGCYMYAEVAIIRMF